MGDATTPVTLAAAVAALLLSVAAAVPRVVTWLGSWLREREARMRAAAEAKAKEAESDAAEAGSAERTRVAEIDAATKSNVELWELVKDLKRRLDVRENRVLELEVQLARRDEDVTQRVQVATREAVQQAVRTGTLPPPKGPA